MLSFSSLAADLISERTWPSIGVGDGPVASREAFSTFLRQQSANRFCAYLTFRLIRSASCFSTSCSFLSVVPEDLDVYLQVNTKI